MPCFYDEGRWRNAKEVFWGKRANQLFDYYLCETMTTPKFSLRNDLRKRSAVWDEKMLLCAHDNLQKTEWNHLVHLTCVCEREREHVCTVCVGTHLMDWPTCVRTCWCQCCPCWFLLWVCHCPPSPSSFCVCKDANVTHEVSIVKKRRRRKTWLGLFAI